VLLIYPWGEDADVRDNSGYAIFRTARYREQIGLR
jgi:hypothetical protein